MGLMKELNALNDIYQNMYAEDENKGYVVTAADKKGNTPAWKGYKAGKKNVKTGKPLYRAADHLKDDVEIEISPEVEKLIESGLFSDAEIAKITDIQEADIADIIARLEKKRISKGGNPDDSPLPAMKKYHADKKKKKVKEDYWREDAQSDAVAQMMGDGGDPQEDAIKQIVRAEKKAAKKKKAKK